MSLADRYADFVVGRPALVVAVMVLLTGGVVAGVVIGDMGGDASVGDVESDSPQAEALDRIEANFATDSGTTAQIVVEGENTLSREALLATLRMQQRIRENETTGPTLSDDEPTVGLGTLVAAEAMRAEGEGPPGGEPLTPAAAIDQLESMDDDEVEATLEQLLAPDRRGPGNPYTFLPNDYEPGETTATARTLFAFQLDLDDQTIQDAQVAMDELVKAVAAGETGESDQRAETGLDRAYVFGVGIVNAESAQALVDSFIILLPIAFLLVVTVFTLAYRDPVDILLGVLGIAAVLGWMAGVMSWLGLDNSQLLIAVPFLLIGLAIDYSLHVVMRYREARAESAKSPTEGMRLGLAGVIGALAAATVSTGVGFFSNIVSPIPAIQDFAIIAAAGIGATLLVFGALIPGLKLLVDRGLEWLGPRLAGSGPTLVRGRTTGWLYRLVFERDKQAVGTGDGRVGRSLVGVVSVSKRVPAVVLVLALLVAAGGGIAATDIDTEFNQQDFLPEEPPEWTSNLPGPFATGNYEVRRNAAFVGDRFDSPGDGGQIQILIEPDGDPDAMTDPETLRAINRTTENAATEDAVVVRADGTAATESPLTAMNNLAGSDEAFATTLADAGGEDGVPDRNVPQLYDELYDRDEAAAARVIARDNGAYTALRMTVSIKGEASAQEAARTGERLAADIDEVDGVTAVATGTPVLNGLIQDDLLATLVQAFFITVVVIAIFLTALYWYKYRAPDVGLITLAPVVCALAWLLGAMWLLEIPFNSETAVITSLAIGLGVDYSIHLSERIVEECADAPFDDGLRTAIQGTGGALLGSASTTAAGFAVLAFALVPPLRRFGTVTGLSIVFAYVACLTVLPSLYVVRNRLVGLPGNGGADTSTGGPTATTEAVESPTEAVEPAESTTEPEEAAEFEWVEPADDSDEKTPNERQMNPSNEAGETTDDRQGSADKR